VAGTTDIRHRYPWTEADERALALSKARRVPHKLIARTLQRTPRAIDQHVAKMKEAGRLQLILDEASAAALSEHDRYESETLRRLTRELLRGVGPQ